MEKRLVTSALPYVNNIPHLGNLVQMLSADVYARFARIKGYDTLYICGTDEYGTATETRAMEEGKTPQELCDYYYKEHKRIYDFFNIAFDIFGRTSNKECTEVTQGLYKDLKEAGYILEKESRQLYCEQCNRFLADRYVVGKCPHCNAENASGDQCDNCGALLTTIELKEPKCTVCGKTPVIKETRHLYLDLPKMESMLKEWVAGASKEGKWSTNAISITQGWIKTGLKERAITRDLKWGIKVPEAGYEKKVFYVWFNASIGYISITRQLENELKDQGKTGFNWKSWWQPEERVKLFQFIGKDNIPFHTVIFPCTLLGSPHKWTKLFHLSATEYLNYEDKKFSKSQGIGVFGTDAILSGIKADAYRFYIFYNRPERQDFQFTWEDFRLKMNAVLIGNLGNLVNRTLLFVSKYYEGAIPEGEVNKDLWQKVRELEDKIVEALDWGQLKDAFHLIFEISDIGNKAFQEGTPWKSRIEEPQKAASLIFNLSYLIKDLMILCHPYMPDFSKTILGYLGKNIARIKQGEAVVPGLMLEDLGKLEGLKEVNSPEVYFKTMDEKSMKEYKTRYGGGKNKGEDKKSGSEKSKKPEVPAVLPEEKQAEFYTNKIEVVVAKIVSVKQNSNGSKLYIETLDAGEKEERTIQSGLVPYFKQEELLEKKILLVKNLTPRTMRGVESRGMLLAVDYKDEKGEDKVELLTAEAREGTRVLLQGAEEKLRKEEGKEEREALPLISIDEFFRVKIEVKDYEVLVGGQKLTVDGKVIKTKMAKEGEVH